MFVLLLVWLWLVLVAVLHCAYAGTGNRAPAGPFTGLADPPVGFPAGDNEAIAVERYRRRLADMRAQLECAVDDLTKTTGGRRWEDRPSPAQRVMGVAAVVLILVAVGLLLSMLGFLFTEVLPHTMQQIQPGRGMLERELPQPAMPWVRAGLAVLASVASKVLMRVSARRSPQVYAQRKLDVRTEQIATVDRETERVVAYQDAARAVEA